MHGDEGEDVGSPSTDPISDSDSGDENIFAYAHVRPTYDIGGNGDVPFVLNSPDEERETQRLIGTYQFENDGTETDRDFWTAYLLGAYQPTTARDGDPNSEVAAVGCVDDINGKGISLFSETHAGEQDGENAHRTYAHELGHLFFGSHDPEHGHDGGIMDSPPSDDRFTDVTLRKIRNIDHP